MCPSSEPPEPRLTPLQRRLAKRSAAKAAKVAEVATAPVSDPRQRERRLADAASSDAALQHNTWDDVQWDPVDLAEAERLVAAQAPTPSTLLEQSERWDAHYEANPRNYHDRRYLHNEFPVLLEPPPPCQRELVVLEIGCGAGNTLLPLLHANPAVRGLACDLAPSAVALARERLGREGLAERADAFVWDVSAPPPRDAPPLLAGGVDVVLAIFTLSALAPDALPTALAQLRACLRPGGRLLLRDYGRLDLKHLKFAAVAGSRLHCAAAPEWEWYARGDGTTALFFTPERLAPLARGAGFGVDDARYDRRLAVNRATRTRMYRVWMVAVLRSATTDEERGARCEVGGRGDGAADEARQRRDETPAMASTRWQVAVLAAVAAAAAVAATASMRLLRTSPSVSR